MTGPKVKPREVPRACVRCVTYVGTLKLNHARILARNTCEEGTASYTYTFAGVYKRYALSDRFAASLMTRNHGTVMSLSYDALCPGGEDAWGRKRGSDVRTRKARDTLEEGRAENPLPPLLCNTHRGYRCIVTLLLPRPSPYAEFTSLLEIQIPRETVVMLLTTLCCLYHVYMSSISLSLSLGLYYVLLVLHADSFAFIALRSSIFLSLPFSPPSYPGPSYLISRL